MLRSITATVIVAAVLHATASTVWAAPPDGAPPGDYDVIVVGDSIGGVAAAVTAGRLGARVALFTFTDYPGGQASAGGMSTFDEGSPVLRQSGLYAELVDGLRAAYGNSSFGGCYFYTSTLCPQPNLVAALVRQWLTEAGVYVRTYGRVDGVIQDGARVNGVVLDGLEHHAHIVIDATERSDLYPMIEGLDWVAGSRRGCVQDMTWPVVLSWYPNGVPPELVVPIGAREELAAVWGEEAIESWLTTFRRFTVLEPGRPSPPEDLPPLPWSWEEETRYRAVADGRNLPVDRPPQTRMVVNLANDSPVPIDALIDSDESLWAPAYRQSLHRSYLYLWYLRYELGITDWSVANDLGYDRAWHIDFDEAIPNLMEIHFPPIPYQREGRRLAPSAITWNDLADEMRATERFSDSVMLGAYISDFHGCHEPSNMLSGFGLYEVPLDVFLPDGIEGFLPGLARAGRVDRTASSSLRMQPTELLGGQVVGTLAAMAIEWNVPPRQIPSGSLREALKAQGALVDVPGGRPLAVAPIRTEPPSHCQLTPWTCRPFLRLRPL